MKVCIWCVSLIAILFVSTSTFGVIHLTGSADSDHSDAGFAEADLDHGGASAGANGDSSYNWALAEGWMRYSTDTYGWFQVHWSLSGSASASLTLSSFDACSAAAAGSADSGGVLGGTSFPLSASVDSGNWQGGDPYMSDSDEPDSVSAAGHIACYPDDAVSTSYGGAAYAMVVENSDDSADAAIDFTAECAMR